MRGYAQFNFPAFDAAERDLSSRGYAVLSPATLDRSIGFDPEQHTLEQFDMREAVRRDVDAILQSDAVVMLPGWEESTGAKAEMGVARWLGLPVLRYPDLQPVESPPAAGQVVGLTGYATAGKDEAARGLTGWTRVSLADPVRAAALALDPLVDDSGHRLSELVDCVGWDAAKRSPEVRRLLQRLGTEAGREIHGGDCWTKIAERKAREVLAAGGSVVFTDIRFPEEAAMVRRLGGKVVRITREGVGPVNAHVSDNQTIDADETVRNDGTVMDLHEAIREAVHSGRATATR